MPQYLAPGIYVEEVAAGARPIAGVGTSTAGFIGLVANEVAMPLLPGRLGVLLGTDGKPLLGADGKPQRKDDDYYTVARAGVPQLVTSWEQFKTAFGDIQAGNSVLAHAVYGFFNNGGTRCFVSRVVGDPAQMPPANQPAPSAATQGASNEPPIQTEENNKRTGGRGQRAEQSAQAAPADEPAAGTLTTRLIAAIDVFKTIDEVALMAIPGATEKAVQDALVNHCASAFQSDRFAILDGQLTDEPLPASVLGGTTRSSYAALYYPWIQVFDPVSGGPIVQPPSGHIAGVFARVDSTRGVHKAPANEVIRGAMGVSRAVSREEQAGLNPQNINVIRAFGNSITIWGARTLADNGLEPEWKYVNVRRLFLFLRESIDEGTQWVAFEPNDASLWGKIRRNISAFLTLVWRSGALFGATADEAFYVRCDETLNDVDTRAQGLVVTEIGVAIVNPAEFVVFRISQWAGPSA